MEKGELRVSLDTRKANRMLSALSKSLPNVINALVKLPEAIGGLLRIDTFSTRAGEIRLAFEPTQRCLNFLATLRTLEGNLSSIKMTSHGETPSMGISQNSTAKRKLSKAKSVRQKRSSVMRSPLAVRG